VTDVSTLRNVTVEMFRLHFPRSTVLNLLRLTLGDSAEAFLSDVEDSIVARAVVKLR